MSPSTQLAAFMLSRRCLSTLKLASDSLRAYATVPETSAEKAAKDSLDHSKLPPPAENLPPPETFSETSRPKQYYKRPERELPPLERRWPIALAFGTVGVGAWALFIAWSENQERLSSSVMRQIMETIRESPELRYVLGEAIRPEPVWWLNGDPWVTGVVRLMQGNVDLSFRLKGHKCAGTLYFTSIRKAKGEPFTILRFKVIADDGTVVNIPSAVPQSNSS